jgi:hypothetical protein
MVKISKSGSGFVKRNNNALLIFIVLPFLLVFACKCPNDPANNCDTGPVKIEHAGTTAVDSCCMSRFILQDGSVFAGPSKYPLRSYRTEYNGSILHIYN